MAATAALGTDRACSAEQEARPDDSDVVRRLVGGAPVESSRVALIMPPVFGNGSSVPLSLAVDSAMTEADHVRRLRVFAPRNPFVLVADFRLTPQAGRAALSTRVRLAQPQSVFAVADMGDGALLMARTWVEVGSDGCQ